ncbi:MAG: DUF3139 domain-containing protein [Firmicutes bacterium]|nr:DUF3139 domain-containing protein [Bacillota bacterium]
MERKVIVIALCIVAVIIFSCFIYVFEGTKNADKLMWEYLEKKGYSQSEIQSVDVSHSFLNIILSYNEWSIAVVYTDEPTSIYYYHIKNGNVVEGGISGTTDKEDFKH